jgi:hypothetical protein
MPACAESTRETDLPPRCTGRVPLCPKGTRSAALIWGMAAPVWKQAVVKRNRHRHGIGTDAVAHRGQGGQPSRRFLHTVTARLRDPAERPSRAQAANSPGDMRAIRSLCDHGLSPGAADGNETCPVASRCPPRLRFRPGRAPVQCASPGGGRRASGKRQAGRPESGTASGSVRCGGGTVDFPAQHIGAGLVQRSRKDARIRSSPDGPWATAPITGGGHRRAVAGRGQRCVRVGGRRFTTPDGRASPSYT